MNAGLILHPCHGDPRNDLFAGSVVRLPACQSVKALTSAVRARLIQAAGQAEPELALDAMSAAELWERLAELRAEIAGPGWDRYSSAILAAAGLPCRNVLIDGLRLRVVVPASHRTPKMAPAYMAHRDTWFANPRQQVNIWMPLHDISEEQSFAFYPEAFGARLANNSGEFHFADFMKKAGWQGSVRSEKGSAVYPTVEGPLPEIRQNFSLKYGEAILFSAAHLHQTMPNNGTRIRYSLDFRFVDPADIAANRGAPDSDNASQGLAEALATYRFLPGASVQQVRHI